LFQNFDYPSVADARAIIEENETWQLYKRNLIAILQKRNEAKIALETRNKRQNQTHKCTKQLLLSKKRQSAYHTSKRLLRGRLSMSAPLIRDESFSNSERAQQ